MFKRIIMVIIMCMLSCSLVADFFPRNVNDYAIKIYSRHNVLFRDNLHNIENSVYMVKAYATYKIVNIQDFPNVKKKLGKDTITKHGYGSIFCIAEKNGDAYFLGCNHTIEFPEEHITIVSKKDGEDQKKKSKDKKSKRPGWLDMLLTRRKMKLKRIKVVYKFFFRDDTDFYETDIKILDTNKELDLALMKMRKPRSFSVRGKQYRIKPLNCKWGKNKKITKGDFVYVLGYPQCLGQYLTSGWICGLSATMGMAAHGKQEYFDKIIFTASVDHGNSGCPMFALNNGKFIFIGVVNAMMYKKYGTATKIDDVVNFLKKGKYSFVLKDK